MNIATWWQKFWFRQAPAYRLAFFRMAIALTTMIYVIPRFNGAITNYLTSSFHMPMFSWMLLLPAPIWRLFAHLQYPAALCLLIGFLPRMAASFLAVSEFCVFALDVQNYSHWGQFHLILLFLLACSGEKIPLVNLFQKNNHNPSTCEVWPEHLIRFQLSIILFYSALEKVFSQYWGTSGTFFIYEFGAIKNTALPISPAIMSVTVIGIEFFLALSFLLRPLWRIAVPLGILFAALLQFFMKPVSFAWDFLAVLILFI